MLSAIYQSLRYLNMRRRHSRGWIRTELRRRNRVAVPHVVGVLAIMKNESHTIDEWVSHYLSIGVDKIFLIDNGSTDDTVSKARRWVAQGLVQLVEYPEQHLQREHYWAAFQQLRIAEVCEWLMIADMDEFWFCKDGRPISDYLRDLPGIDMVFANWSQFGSNGHVAQPSSLRLGFTKRCADLDKSTKSIFRTYVAHRAYVIGVHHVNCVSPFRQITDNQHLQLNHYATQSHHYWFNVKMKRGDVYVASPDWAERAGRFAATDALATLEDTLLRDMVLRG